MVNGVNARRTSRLRTLLHGSIAVALGLIGAVLLLELILRFLPVSEELDNDQPITAADPIRRFRPDATITWSRGFDFHLVNTVRTNNYGFVNDQNYDPSDTRPLLTVIGDSYVEAPMLPYVQTLHGLLAAHIAPKGRVYSFGSSGSALAQYLAYATYARDVFHPAGMAFVIVGNDFDEGLLAYRQWAGFHYFARQPDGSLELQLVEYRPRHATIFHSIGSALGLDKSALVRYLRCNLPELQARLRSPFQGAKDDLSRYVGQTEARADEERLRDAREAVDVFLARIPQASGLPRERLLFVLDGARPHLYHPQALQQAEQSFFVQMRNYFLEQARALGHECLDMQPVFQTRRDSPDVRFEFPRDGHWNSQGHALAAEEVEGSQTWRRVFGSTQ